METLWLLILLGMAVGTFGTLIGAGGGFILVPLLLFTLPKQTPQVITALSIAVVALNALSGSVAYARAGRIDYKAGLLFAGFTIPGSVAGVYVTEYVSLDVFHIAFGLLLLAVSLYTFFSAGKQRQTNSPGGAPGRGTVHKFTDRKGHQFSYSFNRGLGILISVLAGFLSPLLGIGGGIIHVPAMVQLLGFPVYVATATSHFILAIMASTSVVVHITEGSYRDPEVLRMLLGLGIGVVPGAQVGAWISHRTHTTIIIRMLAAGLFVVGVRMLW